MDFGKERELENAGIIPVDFRLMDEGERREVLEDAGLDADSLIDADLEPEFDVWEDLKDAMLSFSELDAMTDEEKRQALQDADLDPDDYEEVIAYSRTSSCISQPKENVEFTSPEPPSKKSKSARPETYRFCSVTFSSSCTTYSYRLKDQDIHAGDYVWVPVGSSNRETMAKVVSVGRYRAEVVPYPVDKAKFIIRKMTDEEVKGQMEKFKEREDAHAEVKSQEQSSYDVKNTIITPKQAKPEPPAQSNVQEKRRIMDSRDPQESLEASLIKKNRHLKITVCLLTVSVILLLFAVGYLYCTTQRTSNAPSPAPTAVITPRPTQKPTASPRPTVKPTPAPTPRPVSTPKPTTKPKATIKPSDPFNAKNYSHPDDFYYDYYDDFWDFEDAEDYWEAHH